MTTNYNQCRYIKPKGTRCKRVVMINGLCYLHLKYIETHPEFEICDEEMEEE